MHSTDYPPESGSTKRRPLFGRSGSTDAEERIDEALAEYRQVLEHRLDEGLLALQTSAAKLMKEIAAEMWRQGGADTGDVQSRILEFVSRDQAVRSLIASSDERFQSLSMRTEQLEGSLRHVAEQNGELREILAAGVRTLEEAAREADAEDSKELRERLAEVEAHISTTMQYIQERDRALVEGIGKEVREHGELVTMETHRVVEGMAGYVSDGVASIGRLAQRVEGHMEAVAGRDDQLAERISTQLSGTLGEQLQLLYERLGMEARSLSDLMASQQSWLQVTMEDTSARLDEKLGAQAETAREAARMTANEVNQLLEARVMGLAQLVRSDSEKLRDQLVENTAAQDEQMARLLDERLARVQQALETATKWTADETSQRIAETTRAAIDGSVAGTLSDLRGALDTAVVDLRGAIDTQLSTVGQQAADAADAAIAGRLDATTQRMSESAEGIERAREAFERMQGEAEDAVGRTIDQRIGALAKMIRSDNQALAQRMAEVSDQQKRDVESDHARQTLRAVKELQATMAGEMMGVLERQFGILAEQLHRETQTIAESLVRSNDVLARRVDAVAAKVQKESGRDMDTVQTAIERMGEAMHALASIGRQTGGAMQSPSDPRSEQVELP